MTEPTHPSASAVDLEDQAIEQWVHLTSGRASEADRSAFARWRGQSADHEAAARLAERIWQALPQTCAAQRFVVPARVTRRPLRWAALAAGVGALALTGLSEPARVYFADYATAVSGVFNLDDIPGMLDMLARTQPVKIYRMPWLTVVVVNQTRA